MNYKYINEVKLNISIYASKKTSNILDGTYRSFYKGKSMNFENLREYVLNDDFKDIDWNASARSGTLLVKQFQAEKKSNVLFVIDSGKKMLADTDYYVSKKKLALLFAGTIGYIAIKNGDYISLAYSNNNGLIYKPFKYNLYNLEEYLSEYDNSFFDDTRLTINDILNNICNIVHKKMIIFVITDLAGIDNIDDKTLKKLSNYHDVMFVNINDNYMYGENIYDLDNTSYISKYILKDKKLYNLEKEIRNNLINSCNDKLLKNNISMVSISSIEQINDKIIELLEKAKLNYFIRK